MTNLKNIQIGNTITVIKLEYNPISIDTKKELTAIAVLLGGYNSHGRAIPIEKYNELKAQFESIKDELKTLL